MKIYALLIVGLVFFSGCTALSGFFGSDVINVKPVTIQGATTTPLEIKDIVTYPTSSALAPGRPVQLFFGLLNTDTKKKAANVVVDLFDAPTFYSSDRFINTFPDLLCNDDRTNCRPNKDDGYSCSITKPCELLPGEGRSIVFDIVAPKEEDIVNIQTQPKLNFKVNYDYTSTLFYVFPVVNYDEIIKRQRAGDPVELGISKSHSSGPIIIDVEIIGERSYGLNNFPVSLNFIIKNQGNGNPLNSKIPAYDGSEKGMRIEFPQNFVIKERSEFFSCIVNVCTNIKPIDLFKDISQMSLRFEIELVDPTIADPFRSFQLDAYVGYNYELRKAVDVTITPIRR